VFFFLPPYLIYLKTYEIFSSYFDGSIELVLYIFSLMYANKLIYSFQYDLFFCMVFFMTTDMLKNVCRHQI